MKLTYNWLKDFVDITLKPLELADKLTMAGLEVKAIENFEDDFVFEIEITSNRPDWLSLIGIAREVAAVTGKKLKATPDAPVGAGRPPPTLSDASVGTSRSGQAGHPRRFPTLRSEQVGRGRQAARNEGRKTKDERRVAIVVEDKRACPFYSARIIRNVKVGPSPKWMVKRLEAIGLRSINNIVDITNYVLFTTGQPLHVFDLDKLSSYQSSAIGYQPKIIVRRARNAEEIITIDGLTRKLTPEILVIADEKKPIAIAGIMGGKDTQVSQATKNILLESAYFSPEITRKSSRYLGLATDSSYRFERSVDKSSIVSSSDLAADFIAEIAGGERGRLSKIGSQIVPRKIISLSLANLNQLLGQKVAVSEIKSILQNLGCKIISQKKDLIKVSPPFFRQDLKGSIDLAEEVFRIAGPENISSALAPIQPSGLTPDILLLAQKKIKEVLVALGLHEVICYSLLNREGLKKAKLDLEQAYSLEKPLSEKQEILRPSLLVGLLETLRVNLELGNKDCAFFEIGECFSEPLENKALGVIIGDSNAGALKSMAELILINLRINQYEFLPFPKPFLKDGQAALIKAAGQVLGVIGMLSQEVLNSYKIDVQNAGFLEINIDDLKQLLNSPKIYKALPKYPSVWRDISLVVAEEITYQQIVDVMMASKLPWLDNISFKDSYRGNTIGEGQKSITLSLEFRSSQKTLTDVEVNTSLEVINQHISSQLKAVLR